MRSSLSPGNWSLASPASLPPSSLIALTSPTLRPDTSMQLQGSPLTNGTASELAFSFSVSRRINDTSYQRGSPRFGRCPCPS